MVKSDKKVQKINQSIKNQEKRPKTCLENAEKDNKGNQDK